MATALIPGRPRDWKPLAVAGRIDTGFSRRRDKEPQRLRTAFVGSTPTGIRRLYWGIALYGRGRATNAA